MNEAPLEVEIDEFDTPAAPPLTADEIRNARQTLAEWQAPGAFKSSTDLLCNRCPSEEWFNSPQLKFLHDAWVLSHFAIAITAEAVRLAGPKDQWPDGYVRLTGRTRAIEVTSTHGGRPVGKEYRNLKRPKLDPIENWRERANSIPKYLEKVIAAKARKNYSSPCWLVVYLNINDVGIAQTETEATIRDMKARYGNSFETISVLWKDRLY